MPRLNLPDAIADYFDADQQHPELLARCFTPRASVKDEGHTHMGREAIQAWKTGASMKYSYTAVPCAHSHEDGVHTVRTQVAGNFPGSPVSLQYRFRLERGLIASLEIGA